jgi:hypothetical protein
MPETPQSSAITYGLSMTASDGAITYFYRESLHRYAQSGKQKISLFPTKSEAELVRTIQNIGELELWDIVEIRLFPDRIDVINL